jgi:transposase
MIDVEAGGVITTDRYGAYNWLTARRRQLCRAHLSRDFQAMVERGGESAVVGGALLKQGGRLYSLWHKVRDDGLSRERLAARMRAVRRKVQGLVEAGTRSEHKKTRRTCANILKMERSLWTFVRVAGVEPTNKEAERASRRAVLWRRKSFGTQSAEGSRFVGRVLTAVASLRQQGRNVLEYLAGVCRDALSGEAREALLPKLSPTTT